MKLSAKAILIPTLVLFLVALIVTAALAGTNMLTAEKIAANSAEEAAQSRLIVLPAAQEFEGAGENNEEYYIGKNSNGETVGYVFTTESSGYGGKVSVMTGMDNDGKVTGVTILSHNETPGLGANAEKESFRQQYIDHAVGGQPFERIKSGEPSDGQILAMTGATITSDAVTNSVNLAIEKYNSVKEGA